MKEDDFKQIAEAIDIVLNAHEDDAAIAKASEIVKKITDANPLPY